MLRSVFSLLLSVLFTLPAFAATINVPADQASIQACHDAAGSGDVCLVADGVYNEQITITKSNITFRAVNKHGAKVDCQDVRDYGFHIPSAESNVTIDGFEIEDCDIGGIWSNSSSSSNIIITNNLSHNHFEMGIRNEGSNCEITDNEIYAIGNSLDSFGIQSQCTDGTIARNQIVLVAKNGLRLRNGSARNLVQDNYVSEAGDCITTNVADEGNDLYNNFVTNCNGGFELKHTNGTSGNPNQIWHNTAWNNFEGNMEIAQSGDPSSWLSIQNNIFADGVNDNVNDDSALRTNLTLDGNLYWNAGDCEYFDDVGNPCYTSLTQIQNNTSFEDNGFEQDPQLINPETGVLAYTTTPPASKNLSSPFGTQLGAQNMDITIQRYFARLTWTAVDASSNTSDMTRSEDLDMDTEWNAATSTNEWIAYDFGSSKTFDGLVIRSARFQGAENPDTVRIQTATSSSGPWTTRHTEDANRGGSSIFHLSAPIISRYVRVFFVDTIGGADVEVREVYAGLLTEPTVPPGIEQASFGFKIHEGAVDHTNWAPGPGVGVSTDHSCSVDCKFRLRFKVKSGGTDPGSKTFTVEYDINNANSWAVVPSSCVGNATCLVDAPDVSNGAATTVVRDPDAALTDVACSFAESLPFAAISLGSAGEAECEASLQIGSTATKGDKIRYRIAEHGVGAIGSYIVIPELTIRSQFTDGAF